jgi:uncharacterized membrane protein
MKNSGNFFVKTLITGLLVIVPVYLAILMLLKVLQSMAGLMKPLMSLLPEGLPAESILALLMLLVVSFLTGLAALSPAARRLTTKLEKRMLYKIPGYEVFRQITQRTAGDNNEGDWQPALIEIEDGLVPGFVVEEHDDGRLTVFVPSVPTPLAGAIYILSPERVHRLNVPFTQAIKTVTRWGAGSKDLIAAMEARKDIQ